MRKFNEFDIAKVVSLCWDEVNNNNNRRVRATNDVLSGAVVWGVDVTAIIGALSTMGRADITAEVMDELRRRGFEFDTNMEL